MRQFFIHIFKGALMGAANVIPGVSGGTIALLTGIYERLIHSISSCNMTAIKLLFKGKFKSFKHHTDLTFLLAIIIGILISILFISQVLEYLFIDHKLFVWSYFFGLIVASVYFVGKNIHNFSFGIYILFITGSIIAGSLLWIPPASGSSSALYLIICGSIAMCSMILPGLSGSFILILMGTYEIIISAIPNFNMNILIPFFAGAFLALLLFTKLLSWIFKNFYNHTLALLTGFLFGSLGILWPWKIENDSNTSYIYQLPNASSETFTATILIVLGIISIIVIEIGSKKTKG